MSELLTAEKIIEIITVFELDRNTVLKDVVNNGDINGDKDRKIKMLESLSRNLLAYKRNITVIPENISN